MWPQLSMPVASIACQVGIYTGDSLGKRSVMVKLGHFCGEPGKIKTVQHRHLAA